MEWTLPGFKKFLNAFPSSGSEVVEWTSPKIWHLVEILEILLFHVLANDACKFAINLFPITCGPFENVNLLYFLLKMQMWNDCNVLNIAGNPIKDINVNLSFLSSRLKVVEWTPQDSKNLMHSWVQDQKLLNGPPPRSDIWWKFWKFYFFHVLSNDACKFAINLFPIIWGPFEAVNLLYFLLKMQIWNGCNVFNIAGNPTKDINAKLSSLSSGWKVVEWTPPGVKKFLNAFPSSASEVVEWDTPI